jgi:hypothetical protein
VAGIKPTSYSKTNIKIPQIVRWRVAGITDKRIAAMLGMTPSGLAQILATPEYIEEEAAYLNGHLTAMDRAMAGKIEAIHQSCRQAVPAALRALVDTVTQRRDLKAAMTAAKEILDRDPDRTLVQSRSDEAVAPGVPVEVIEAAAKEGNAIAQNYDANAPSGTKVN